MSVARGAALGALILVLNPVAMVVVALCAFFRRYPWWLVTPDDPTSPFGAYEPAMQRVYLWPVVGRWCGDVYWLALRNCLYGLAYRCKPDDMKGVRFYLPQRCSHTQVSKRVSRWYAHGYEQLTVRLVGRFCLVLGWKVDGVVLDPLPARKEVNMDFRPVFTVRANVPFGGVREV